jgi:hypothetical protein
MDCKELFKKSLIRLDSKTCESFFYGLEHYLYEGLITWAKFVEIEIAGVLRRIGLVGKLSDFAFASMQT